MLSWGDTCYSRPHRTACQCDENHPPTTPLTIITDSQYVINGLTKYLGTWEDIGWTGISNAEWLQATAYQLRRRAAPTNFKWVKGHNKTLGNEKADELANQGARKNHPDTIDRTVPTNFCLPGIKLTTITQRIAYAAIRQQYDDTYTRNTLMNLDIIRHTIQETTNNLKTNATIWKNLRHPDIRRPIQNFLYRATTGSLRIGDFRTNIPNYETRALCPHCKTTESLQHILTECDTEETTTIWNLTKNAWPNQNWTTPSLSHILGCGNITPTTEEQENDSQKQRGITRLQRILLSESAYLLWMLRCRHVISNESHSRTAITTQWRNAIETRLNIDRRLAKAKRTKNTKTKILHTWTPIISDPETLPHDWTTNLEVLVGIKLPRPPA